MTDTYSPILGATDLVPGQAIPETKENERFRRGEQGAGYFRAQDKDANAPPGSPADGVAYIVGPSPTGAWSGQAEKIAYYQAGTGWLFITPINGFRAYVVDEGIDYRYDGADWVVITAGSTGGLLAANNLSDVVSASAARTNLSVYSQAQVDSAIAASVAGLLEDKGPYDCSANPNYPAASKGDAYRVTVAGKIGGASGVAVEVGDVFIASADNAGGTQAAVDTSWYALQANLTNAATRTRMVNLTLATTVLGASEVLGAITPPSGETWTFGANFAGASGLKLNGGTNPASSFVIDVKKNGTSVGTITISTGSAVTFATSGGTSFSLTGGSDELQFIGPATPGTALGFAFAIPATY